MPYLVMVDVKNGVQSNKYYEMIDTEDGNFTVNYGRVGVSKTTLTYPLGRFNSIYKSKIRKGYKDITDLKTTSNVITSITNKEFEEFFNVFSKYTTNLIRKTYQVEGCTPLQLKEAQKILNHISQESKIDDINDLLLSLYKVIPRRMSNVRDHLLTQKKEKNKIIHREQNYLDSMDSSMISQGSDPFKDLNISFKEIKEIGLLEKLIYPTSDNRVKIHKVYEISKEKEQASFKKHLTKCENKKQELLIHGTRNPNVFSILKSGLKIRPSNAARISGAAYGNGIYHSAHTKKSLGYTGYQRDKLFFIQKVHMGNFYTYDGWRSHHRDEFDLNLQELTTRNYDSVFVKPTNGLLNSEYIVYKEEQSIMNYLIWLK